MRNRGKGRERMTDLSFHLGILQGFLVVRDAPQEIRNSLDKVLLYWDTQRVLSESHRIAHARRVPNEEVRLEGPDDPQIHINYDAASQCAHHIQESAKTSPSHDESRSAPGNAPSRRESIPARARRCRRR